MARNLFQWNANCRNCQSFLWIRMVGYRFQWFQWIDPSLSQSIYRTYGTAETYHRLEARFQWNLPSHPPVPVVHGKAYLKLGLAISSCFGSSGKSSTCLCSWNRVLSSLLEVIEGMGSLMN